ncbi:MAG: MFS transporter [Pseudomonadota bacterium]
MASVGNAGIWVIIMILPAVQETYEISRSAAAIPYAATMAGFALGNLALGRAVDAFRVAPVLFFAALVVACGYLLAPRAGSVALLSVCQMLIGFGSSVCFGPLIADISHWFLRRRGVAVAITACGNYLAGAIWPFALRGVLDNQGWPMVYAAMAVITLLVLVPGAMGLRQRLPDTAKTQADSLARANRESGGLSPRVMQALLLVAGLACCMAMSMPQVHIVALCVDLGFGEVVGAEMLSLMLVGGVVSRFASGFLADRFGGVKTVMIGSVLQALALALYLPSTGMTGLYAVSLAFGLSQGGIVPSYAVIVREYLPAAEAGTRVGIVIVATIVGMAFGGWVAGWIYDQTGSYYLAFINGIGWNLLNLAVMLAILAGVRRRPDPSLTA